MSNPQYTESPRKFRIQDDAEAASARQHATLEARAKQTANKNLEPERPASIEDLHHYLDETVDEPHGELASILPEVKSRAGLCQDFFRCNIWDVEPHLLDDLRHALTSGNSQHTDELRRYIRAASWASHGPVNIELARKLANEHLERVKGQKILNHDELTRAERILETTTANTCNEEAENATQDIELLVEAAWRDFVTAWKEEKIKNPDLWWPITKAPLHTLGFPKKLLAKGEQLVKLREIRDHIYFNRLHKNLCRIATIALYDQRKRSF